MWMIKFRLTYTDAATRVAEVIEAVLSSDAWERYSRKLPDLTFMEAREPFRHIFGAYEGGEGEEWLGVMENMVIDEMRLNGPCFAANPATIDAIVVRMASHPNVRLAS